MNIRIRGRKKIEIKNQILPFFLMALLIEPEGISHLWPVLDNLIWRYGGRLCAVILVFFLLIQSKERIRFDKQDYLLFAYLGISFAVTVLKGESVIPWITLYGNVIVLEFLVLIYRKNLPVIIRCTQAYLEILIYINLICMLMYPNGMYISMEGRYTQNWFLGYKSSFQYYIVPAVIFGCYNYECSGKWVRFGILLSVCFIEAVLSQNMMLVGGLLILFVVLFFRLSNRTALFNGTTYFIAVIVVNVAMVFFNTVVMSSNLASTVLDVLNKNANLSGRINIIWPNAMQYIRQHWIIGYGVLSSSEHTVMFGNIAAIHCHNQMLEVLLTGGILLFTIYMLWLYTIFKQLNKRITNKASQILGAGSCIILIMVSVEVFMRFPGCGVWLMLILAGKCDRLLRSQKSGKRKYPSAPKFRINRKNNVNRYRQDKEAELYVCKIDQ